MIFTSFPIGLQSFAKTEAEPPCISCEHSKHLPALVPLPRPAPNRITKSTKPTLIPGTVCPYGRKPVRRYCSKKFENDMVKIMGKENVKCYSNLFELESSCSTTVIHDPVKAKNPHVGIGLCAIEQSPLIRHNNGRGPACGDIGTLAQQLKCCVHLMTSTKGNYFGTVRCGNVPVCGGKA